MKPKNNIIDDWLINHGDKEIEIKVNKELKEKLPKMKIYVLETQGELEYIAANTAIHALKVYEEITGNSLDSFRELDDIWELSEENYDIQIKTDEGMATLRELFEGTKPDILASTAV